jgi:hypothetical protein
MPIMDVLTKFASAEPAFGTVAVRLEGSQIDLGAAHRDPGNGKTVYLIVQVTEAWVSAGSATVNIQLVSDSTASIAVDGSATVHLSLGTLAYTVLTLNKRFCVALPLEGNVYERYLGIIVDTAGATTTAGAFTAFLSPDPVGWQAYPAATTRNVND